MNVSLFIPCYMDQLYPGAAMATLEILEKHGCKVDFPEAQTCCGQPMANTGCAKEAKPVAEHFLRVFEHAEYIVCPSGSCTSMVRNHYHDLVGDHPQSERIFEFSEFLVDVLKVDAIDARFPHKVGIHKACHGLRELRLGRSSERMDAPYSKLRQLLEMVDGLEVVDLERPDECCGFGGTFSINEEAISCSMGRDRIEQHQNAGAEFIVSADMSCLMHLGGLIKRDGTPIETKHIAEVLNAR